MNTTTNTESRAIVAAGEHTAPLMHSPGSTALILDPGHLKNMMAIAEIMAKGIATVPRHLQKNAGDCLAVVMQATQWGMNPFAVAQKTHLVNGILGYEAQLVNSVVNSMAPTKDRINYEWFGDWDKIMGKFEERESKKKVDEDTGKPLKYRVPAWNIKDEAGLGVKVWATMKGEDQPRELVLQLVQCRVRNSPLWADDPRQQIAYLAVKRWTRLHCPDVLLGVYTRDELEESRPPRDMGPAEVVEEDRVDVEPVIKMVASLKTDEAAATFWRENAPKFAKQQGDYQRLKDAVIARRLAIKEANTVENKPASDAPGEITFAIVMDKMLAAKNPDALAVAADWINAIDDAAQKAELNTKFDELQRTMEESQS